MNPHELRLPLDGNIQEELELTYEDVGSIPLSLVVEPPSGPYYTDNWHIG